MGKEAIYRRLRGEVPFTFQEAAIISKELGISLDRIAGVSFSNNAMFDINVVDHGNPFETYYDFLNKHVKLFHTLREDPNASLGTASNVIPQTLYLKHELLAKFRFFKWMYQNEHIKCKHFEELEIPQKIINVQQDFAKLSHHIHSTDYIWDSMVFLHLINDIQYFSDSEFDGVRIDKYLSVVFPDLSRSFIQKAIDCGNVSVNGKTVAKNYKLKTDERIEYIPLEAVKLEVKAQNIPLDIVYEDDDLLVVNKPKGMVVHPAPGNYENTLVNALLFHCKDSLSGINGVLRPGIVHRIDKDTSGLLIVAKNDFSHRALAEQIKAHSFTREYRAVTIGHLKESSGRVVAPIGRNPRDRKKMAVTDKNSKNAVTNYEVLREYRGYSLLKLRLETGRTHQIRVHMAYLGHPLAGDFVYGTPRTKEELALNGQCLHAGLIGFIHPRTNEYVEFTSDLPLYFKKFIGGLTVDE